MGFISSATTINIKGKLTPLGRQRLITNTNALITKFSLGDSDTNYTVFSGLTNGQVPDFSGDNAGGSINNGGAGYVLKSTLLLKTGGNAKKSVDPASFSINSVFTNVGINTVYYSGGSITQDLVNRNDFNTDTLTNLFYSFGLPIDSSEVNTYTGITASNGGYSNTALSGISDSNILVVGLNSGEYGEIIDGKTLKLDLTTTANTYNMYGTYENKGTSLSTEDNRVSDSSSNVVQFGPNVCLLFSDLIKRPNGDAAKSWATGYGANKPFSTNGKEMWNFVTDSNISATADTAVGVAYLDKGFMVITEPTIVDDFQLAFSASTATTIEFNSVVSTVSQQITCIANRNEFTSSNNKTFRTGDTPQITEIGLFDDQNNLIAVAKTNRTYYKPVDDIVVFNVIIDY
jgi:hypothetical protein